jgi:membrane associated rhomboid family serine protease
MSRIGSSPFAFPDFRGATRRLVLLNLATYFALLVAGLALSSDTFHFAGLLVLDPAAFLHGYLWQPLTYSFVHTGLIGTLLELLSLWFLAGFLEGFHDENWVMGLYAVSVLGTTVASAESSGCWRRSEAFTATCNLFCFRCRWASRRAI